MKIDGREIAQEILLDLAKKVESLKKSEITPTMAILLMGDNKASEIYVRQKTLKAESIGAKVELFRFPNGVTNEKVEKILHKLIRDKNIHGIILQRPAPKNINADKLTELVPPEKEIDGFGLHPIYSVPVAEAVLELLKNVHGNEKTRMDFLDWLRSKKIILIGKGETAGKPIIEHFAKIEIYPTIVDSKTKSRGEVIKSGDIVIPSVGNLVVSPGEIKKGAILISVGIYTNEEGKLKGDYEDEKIQEIASFYSPTPGGVGPVNVACLLKNLVEAASSSEQR
ncbi:MAG: methylenetetrahydrofolate dehydrogenase (NADP+) / methenyltetrahydrofolate cyclohydrolase [uncultured bacterium]|nr:MAG: methylenetetrahydrofolate dehydrogenase (NADP+) / methenyltetrahydrofolate cyclohydrolase [uncultured bacterium]